MLTTLDLLKSARATLDDPSRWTKFVLARNAFGNETEPEDPDARRWCLIGSLYHAAPGQEDAVCEAAYWLSETIADLSGKDPNILGHGQEPVANLNDAPETTHEHVLVVLDRAIAAETARQAAA